MTGQILVVGDGAVAALYGGQEVMQQVLCVLGESVWELKIKDSDWDLHLKIKDSGCELLIRL